MDNVTCEICGEHFERIEHLKTHTNLKHMDSCKFDCPICGKRMGNISSKISHMRVHEEGKYVCKICGKALKKKKSLLIHERTHTGEKPFK